MKLTKEVVEKISSIKGEPKWMLDFRLRSLDAFLKSSNPNFGPKLDIDYDNITYYKERENNLTDDWNNISCDVRNIFDDLGVISVEKKYLDGMGAQYDSEVIYHNMNEELKRKNVIFMDTDSALREHPELLSLEDEIKQESQIILKKKALGELTDEELKAYQVKQLIEFLEQEKLI